MKGSLAGTSSSLSRSCGESCRLESTRWPHFPCAISAISQHADLGGKGDTLLYLRFSDGRKHERE